MAYKCPECGRAVSLKWFFWSSNTTHYTCPQCGTVLEWTRTRSILAGILGGLAYPAILLMDHVAKARGLPLLVSIVFVIPLYIAVGVALYFSVPGQFKKKCSYGSA